MRMGYWTCVAPVLFATIAACGGGGGTELASAPPPVTPTPTPAPTPTPTPPAFEPVPATVFAEPLYNQNLTVVGKGWQHDYTTNTAGSSNLRDAENLTIAYDPATRSYQVSAPVAGSGTIMQTGAVANYESYAGIPAFPADPSNKGPTAYCCNTLSLTTADQPQSRYRYASFVGLYATQPASSDLDSIAYGIFALVQPTKPGDVPTTGSARYSGDVVGHFAGDAGATWLEGKSIFEFDFALARLSGSLDLNVVCMMGCLYDPVTYTLTNTQFTQGATTFSGNLATAGAPSEGTFSGLFAGPEAAEMAARFLMPFYHPEQKQWVDAGGAIIGKRN